MRDTYILICILYNNTYMNYVEKEIILGLTNTLFLNK